MRIKKWNYTGAVEYVCVMFMTLFGLQNRPSHKYPHFSSQSNKSPRLLRVRSSVDVDGTVHLKMHSEISYVSSVDDNDDMIYLLM